MIEKKFKPMLAKLGNIQDLKRTNMIFEPKLDGTRALLYKKRDKLTIINRRGVILNSRYPELLEIVNNIKARSTVLDGEIIIIDPKTGKPNFYKLAEREHLGSELRIEILSKQIPATYVVFDVLYLDKKNLTTTPLIQRKKILKKIIQKNEIINLCFYTENGEKLYKIIRKLGLEGVMGKRKKSLYYPGERKDCWLKIKHLKILDVILCGFTTGTGWRGELLGSLIAGCYREGKLRYVGKVGTGFSEDQLRALLHELEKIKTEKCPFPQVPDLKLPPDRKPVWVKPKLVCEVRFMNLSKDLIMRAPSFIRMREDKEPRECIMEV